LILNSRIYYFTLLRIRSN